ncbi:MAG: serine--tRNA ligase [Flavobacteriales bacterium]|nr:serine--tRNA ligase [Flavobacteriales bacterium]MCW8913629.1 serine--tRNA ligase [Flavobacteriales bacterium]MCW8937133.1 serine--tRNA ligase [Flavobacteriales bacterium]MCW8941193.1 serine--tRNA ligase [Flavobacteriales bacterium]MCW8968532.1 serine--tRNA ligase [Flavobacteriales bacterium]
MLQTNFIKENKVLVIERLKKRNIDATPIVENIIQLDDDRKKTQQTLDSLLSESNQLAKKIGDLFKAGKAEEANALKAQTTELKEKSNTLKEQQNNITDQLNQLLYQLPNIPNELVPNGKTDSDNELIFENNKKVELAQSNKKPHWELAKTFDLIDFELGVKITGAGFPIYKGKGAKLQRALINFFLNEADKNGYQEIIPPLMVNEASGYGTGQLPDKEGQMYYVTEDDLYLIPTAEVPITNIYRDVILKEEDFPIKNAGYTPCFRREAGSYGKDVRGLNRLHQFDKVEIVQIQHPEKSYETLETMVEQIKQLLNQLDLPYRVVRLCGGDLGFTSAMTYDFEVYSAAQEKWLEVSSVSNFEAFQANRLKCRYKDKDGKTNLVHTLNGSALALPRIMAALIENNQTENGIKIPEVLVPFTGFNIIN